MWGKGKDWVTGSCYSPLHWTVGEEICLAVTMAILSRVMGGFSLSQVSLLTLTFSLFPSPSAPDSLSSKSGQYPLFSWHGAFPSECLTNCLPLRCSLWLPFLVVFPQPRRPSVVLTHMLVDSLNDLLKCSMIGFLKLPQWELSMESWPHNISLVLSFGVISPDQLPSVPLDLANLELGWFFPFPIKDCPCRAAWSTRGFPRDCPW